MTRPVRTKPRGYIENYNPTSETRHLLADVTSVLERYLELLPLTVRQIFYILIGQFGYQKSDAFYQRLCGHVSNARRGRMIKFSAIRDDGALVSLRPAFADKDAFYERVRSMGQRYVRDKLARQPFNYEIWAEAAGIVPQLERTARAYSIPVYSTGGFDSTTVKHALAQRICASGKPTVIFHLGDLDPSGVAIFRSAAEDVRAFVLEDRRWLGVDVEFVRVALTIEHVRGLNLVSADRPKQTDSRSDRWPYEWTWQLESLPPDQLARVLGEAIDARFDVDILAEDLHLEQRERREIVYSLPAAGETSA